MKLVLTMLSIFLLLLMIVIHNASGSFKCLPHSDCECGRGTYDSREIVCPKISAEKFEVTLKLDVKPGQSANIQCNTKQGEVEYKWLGNTEVGSVKTFAFTNCPLPNESLKDFFAKWGITNVEKLILKGKYINHTLDEKFFQGLSNIKYLEFYNVGPTTFLDELFNDMNNLMNINVRDSFITLSKSTFGSIRKLKRLELANANLTYLQDGIFQHLTDLQILNLWGNSLRNITRETFLGLSNLTTLGLNNNGITLLAGDVFADLYQLKNLSLYGNNFTSLPSGLFRRTLNLKNLRLNSNRKTLASLPSGLLADLPALHEVQLQDCGITSLPEDLIWGAWNLTILELSYNAIRVLPQLLFRDAAELKELDISHNKLHILPENIFVSLNKLQTLHLEYNDLTNLTEPMMKGLGDLQTLYLNNNKLHHIHTNTFSGTNNLITIDLSVNDISFINQTSTFNYDDILGSWSPLQYCTHLEVLRLANNSISKIFVDWLVTLTKLQELDLRYNKIKILQVNDMHFVSNNLTVDFGYNLITDVNLRQFHMLAEAQDSNTRNHRNVTIKLDNNPLRCECNFYYFLKYLEQRHTPKYLHIMHINPDHLFCADPPEYSGKLVTELHSDTFSCKANWITCPNSCSCSYRPKDGVSVVNCSGGKLRKVPLTLPNATQIELLLENNSLDSLPKMLPKGYSKVTKLTLSHNNITWLTNASLPSNLKELRLDHNNLSHISSDVLKMWNKTDVSLHNNPWVCDCDALDLFNFLQTNFKQVEYLNNVTCRDGRSLARLTAKELCPLMMGTVIAVSVTIAVIGIIIGFIAALYFRYQIEVKVWLYAHNMCLWFVTEEEMDRTKIYDAFVSYSHKDEDFVANKLIPGLENGPRRFKLCVHYRNWIAGEYITTQITRSVQESRRTLVILSPNFIKSEWGRLEFRAAHKQALCDGRARVIIVLYGDIGPTDKLDDELRTYLSTNTYVKWGDPWFWDKLYYALPHPPKIKGILMTSGHFRNATGDKLELINPSTPPAATTPPTGISVNPLDTSNGYINHGCSNLYDETGDAIHGTAKCA